MLNRKALQQSAAHQQQQPQQPHQQQQQTTNQNSRRSVGQRPPQPTVPNPHRTPNTATPRQPVQRGGILNNPHVAQSNQQLQQQQQQQQQQQPQSVQRGTKRQRTNAAGAYQPQTNLHPTATATTTTTAASTAASNITNNSQQTKTTTPPTTAPLQPPVPTIEYTIELSDYDSDEDEYMILDIYDHDVLQKNNILDGLMIKNLYSYSLAPPTALPNPAVDTRSADQGDLYRGGGDMLSNGTDENNNTTNQHHQQYYHNDPHVLIQGAPYPIRHVPNVGTMYIYGYDKNTEGNEEKENNNSSNNNNNNNNNNTTTTTQQPDSVPDADRRDGDTNQPIKCFGVVKHHFALGFPSQ